MRISTNWSQQLGVIAMTDQHSKLTRIQEELSTGLKVIRPSDDPIGSVRMADLQVSITKTEQYDRNINMAKPRLEAEETAIQGAEDIIMRAQDLTLQALNATMTTSDRLAIKFEVDELLQELVGLANTRDSNGEYIFSGDLSDNPAYTYNSVTHEYDYSGGFDQRKLQIATDRKIPDGDIGFNVFSNIDSVSQEVKATVNGAEIGERSLFATLQSLAGALSGSFKQPNATLTGDRFVKYGMDYRPIGTDPNAKGATSFTLTSDDPTLPAPATISETINLTTDFDSLQDVVNEINSQINAAAPITMRAQLNGNQIEFVSLTEGAQSSISIANGGSGDFMADFGFVSGTNDSALGVDVNASVSATKQHPFPFDYSTSPATFDIIAADGSFATINLTANYNDPSYAINFANLVSDIQAQITGSAIDGKIQLNSTADPLVFEGVVPGGSSSVQIKDDLNQGASFFDNVGLISGVLNRDYEQVTQNALDDLGTALEHLVQVKAGIGAKLNAFDDQVLLNEKLVLDLKTTLSEVKDLDFTEAISRFNMQQASFQAAQQAYAKVQGLTLFNFI